MKPSKIAIVGAGVVGSTTAYSLIMSNIASEIILVDINQKKCKGEVFDLSDAISFSSTSKVQIGTLQDAGKADITIISAGIAQKPGQTRTELLNTNVEVVKNVINQMKPLNSDLIIIMVTNPVDILTYIAQQISGLPKSQVFGSGTMLDTQRLRDLIGKKINISQRSIHLYVLGEHGDSQFVSWSSGTIAGIDILNFSNLNKNELFELANISKRKAYDIIDCKGSTAFGVASCVSAYCQNILFNTKRVVPVSCFIEEFDVCMSMPAVLSFKGIEKILIPNFNDEEQLNLKKTIKSLKDYLEEVI
jgi:L-lactate dehydrogenase